MASHRLPATIGAPVLRCRCRSLVDKRGDNGAATDVAGHDNYTLVDDNVTFRTTICDELR